jgi:chitin disaccharide deacetylase
VASQPSATSLFLLLEDESVAAPGNPEPDQRHGKRLILHADDFGLCASVNRATIAALESEAISSASVMAPCDYFEAAADYARRHPEMDIGLHLTVTSEWPARRWGPVAEPGKVRSLVDEDGCFYADADVMSERARPEEIYIELSAQMKKALAADMKPTHLDTHMFALFYNDALYSVYRQLAQEYGLPFLVPSGPSFSKRTRRREEMLVHALLTARPEIPAVEWTTAYVRSASALRPRVTQMNLHLGYDDSELRGITGADTPWGAAWRQRDLAAVESEEFRRAVRSDGVVLTRWRELAEL